MPRRLLGILILLLASVSVMWAQGDVMLLTVGTDTVTRNEFVYHLGRSWEKRGHVFVQTYIRFKQKVQYAKDLGLDTLEAYRRQVDFLQRSLEGRMKLNTEGSLDSSPEKEWIRLVHVTCPLSQHASRKEERRSMAYLDSLYAAWDGKSGALMEALPWMQERHLLNEWQTQLAGLEKGECSRPFYSPLGVHLIAWTDRRVERMEGRRSSASEEAFRRKEMEEGLLVASLDDYWEKMMVGTPQELDAHFKRNKEKFGWGTPHYKGAVIHCRDKKEAKRIRKYLKKFPEELWMDAWKRMPADVSDGCLMEVGLFPIGTNPSVDFFVFKCGENVSKEGYPYAWVLGKKLKKGPNTYRDVFEKVENDWRKTRKNKEIEALNQKYRVEIDEEVLKTVNHYGNK